MIVFSRHERLPDILGGFAFGYLIAVGDGFHAHSVAIDPALDDGVFHLGSIGNAICRYVNQHAEVTLLWRPSSVNVATPHLAAASRDSHSRNEKARPASRPGLS